MTLDAAWVAKTVEDRLKENGQWGNQRVIAEASRVSDTTWRALLREGRIPTRADIRIRIARYLKWKDLGLDELEAGRTPLGRDDLTEQDMDRIRADIELDYWPRNQPVPERLQWRVVEREARESRLLEPWMDLEPKALARTLYDLSMRLSFAEMAIKDLRAKVWPPEVALPDAESQELAQAAKSGEPAPPDVEREREALAGLDEHGVVNADRSDPRRQGKPRKRP